MKSPAVSPGNCGPSREKSKLGVAYWFPHFWVSSFTKTLTSSFLDSIWILSSCFQCTNIRPSSWCSQTGSSLITKSNSLSPTKPTLPSCFTHRQGNLSPQLLKPGSYWHLQPFTLLTPPQEVSNGSWPQSCQWPATAFLHSGHHLLFLGPSASPPAGFLLLALPLLGWLFLVVSLTTTSGIN